MGRVAIVLSLVALALVGAAGATTRALHVYPASAARGAIITVSGKGCRAGDTVYLISPPFLGSAFVQHSVATRARANGVFSRRVTIRRSVRPGRYLITARCGGGNLGLAAHLRIS